MKMRVLLVGVLGACVATQAQILVEGGVDRFIPVSTNISPFTVTVGQSTANNSLTLPNEIALISGAAYVGQEAAATNNWLVLESASAMGVGGKLYVGDKGSDNVVWVQAGSYLEAIDMIVGSDATADGNIAYVDGGVVVVNGGLSVGDGGSGNSLTVTNGGSVSANNFVVGVQSGSEDNWALVDGSALHAVNVMAVGFGGSSNLLELANGAQVSAVTGYVGYADNANSNLMTISESEFTADGLVIGSISNQMNKVLVNDGGIVTLGELIIEGTNSFELNDGGTLVATADFNASTNGFNWNEGGTLDVYGELTGVTGLESNKTLGANGTWNETGNTITVGGTTSGNALNVGGEVTIGTLELGTGSNVVNNALAVSGNGAHLVTDDLVLGHAANSNNSVNVNSDGRLVIKNSLTIDGDNTFSLSNGGWVTISNSFDASIAGFEFGEKGIFEVSGTLTGMTNVLDGERSLLLTGGAWDAGVNPLAVGTTNGSAIVKVTDGGSLVSTDAILDAAGSQVLVDGAGSSWVNGGNIIVGDTGSMNKVVATNGAGITTTDLEIGNQADGNEVLVSGAGSTLTVNNNLNVGVNGSSNRLLIEDGAVFNGANALVGGSGTGNWAIIQGTGSQWQASGNVIVDGLGNGISVADGGVLDVGTTLSVFDGAELEVLGDSTVEVANYEQHGQSALEFDSATEVAPVIDASGTATFETNATIRFTGAIDSVDVGETNTRQIVSSTTLDADVNSLNAEAENGLFMIELSSSGGDLFMELVRQGLGDSAGFETNSQMYAISTEIDTLATDGDQNAINQLEVLGGLSTGADGQQNAQLTQLYERSVPTYMHMEGLNEGMRQVQNRGIVPDDYWPVGVSGPHFPGSQAQLWFKGFGSWGSQSEDGGFSGYDQSVYGLVIGYDKAFEDLLFGLAGGYSMSNIDQDDGDTSDSGIGYGILYGSYGSKSWFGDVSLAYGMGSVENKTGTAFDTKADIDASQFGFYLGGGKEFVSRLDSLFITPTLAISGGNWMQDSYKEKSSNSVVKNVEEYNRWSFMSEVGVETVFRKELRNSILMPELRAKWLHEFNTDEDSLGYTLEGGTGNYSFGMISPVSDLFELGAGLSLWKQNKQGTVYEYAIGYDARIGSGYMANILNARVNIEF